MPRFKAGDRVRVAFVGKKLPNGRIKVSCDELYIVESYDPEYGWVHCTVRPEISLLNIFHVTGVRRVG